MKRYIGIAVVLLGGGIKTIGLDDASIARQRPQQLENLPQRSGAGIKRGRRLRGALHISFRSLDYILWPKNKALANSLLVPYQKALKLVLSVKAITRPRPILCTLKGTVLGISFALIFEWYPEINGFWVY